MIKRDILYYVAGIIWGIPGVIITLKGISAYMDMSRQDLWWLLIITTLVLTGFVFMFTKIVAKYCRLIASEPQKTSIWKTFPLRGWILIVFMTGLGVALKFIGVPAEFTASFYSGLGPGLLWATYRFFVHKEG